MYSMYRFNISEMKTHGVLVPGDYTVKNMMVNIIFPDTSPYKPASNLKTLILITTLDVHQMH